MMITITIGIGALQIGVLMWMAYEIKQIRLGLDRQGVERSQPAIEQPTVSSWLATDALQAAQEQSQIKAANKIANAVRWR